MKIVADSKKKLVQDKKEKNIRIRPVSSGTYAGASRPFSGISAISAKSKVTTMTQQELG